MTRINAFIPPAELSDKHLLAEHREIKRIPNVINSGKAVLEHIPTQFTLGKGHVKFFYNKVKFLFYRYDEIYKECIKRGFNIQSYHEAFAMRDATKENFKFAYHDWDVSQKELSRIQTILRQRIKEKTNGKKEIEI